jgi:hypothetical protein
MPSAPIAPSAPSVPAAASPPSAPADHARGAADASPRRLVVAAVHAALVIASWLFATVVYAIVIARSHQLGWIAFDAAVIAGGAAIVHARRDALGFRSLGPRRGAKLVGIIALGTVGALLVQLAIRDRSLISLDESSYLATVRAGRLLRDGQLPFNLRWLVPMLAGRWNVLPVDDADAIKAINFGGFAVTAALLVLLLVRLRVRLGLALAAPAFLLASYLGVYGATNRLVIDAFNYAMYVVAFHLVIRRDHAAMFAAVLVISACNAEKAVFWLPVVALVIVLRDAPASSASSAAPRGWLRDPRLVRIAGCCAPTLLYLIAIRLYLAGSTAAWTPYVDNLHVLALSPIGGEITDKLVQANTFQRLWLPFGPFTIYALLGLGLAPRWMKPIALLILPIVGQTLIASDSERMVAYAFIVYLPFGYLYLARALGELPRQLARPVFGVLIAVTLAEHFLIPLASRFRLYPVAAELFAAADQARLAMSAIELAMVGALVFVHATWFARGAAAAGRDRRDTAEDPS